MDIAQLVVLAESFINAESKEDQQQMLEDISTQYPEIKPIIDTVKIMKSEDKSKEEIMEYVCDTIVNIPSLNLGPYKLLIKTVMRRLSKKVQQKELDSTEVAEVKETVDNQILTNKGNVSLIIS